MGTPRFHYSDSIKTVDNFMKIMHKTHIWNKVEIHNSDIDIE